MTMSLFRSPTRRQIDTALVVRTEGPVLDPSWTVTELGLEDLVLSYMERPTPDLPRSAGAPGGPTTGSPTLEVLK